MTEQEYREAVHKSLHVETGPAWNQRFLTALEANGLKLVPFPGTVTDQGYYQFAPEPVAYDSSAVWGESLIVPYYHEGPSGPKAQVRVRLVPQEPAKPPAVE